MQDLPLEKIFDIDYTEDNLLASRIEKVVFAAHNQMRKSPKSFIPVIDNQIKNFEANKTKLRRFGRPDLITQEGVRAWYEARNSFKKQRSLPELIWNDGLALAAQDHCTDTGSKGVVSHDGSDGSKVWDRMERYGVPSGTMGENLSFGKSHGDEYMVSLFIDDGVADRGHRTAIQSTRYKKAGVAYCHHDSEYNGMVAIAYATDYKISSYGRAEIKRRFKARRVGSNLVEVTEQVSTRPNVITYSKKSSKPESTVPSFTPIESSPEWSPGLDACTAKETLEEAFEEASKSFRASVNRR